MENCKKPSDNILIERFIISTPNLVYDLNGEYKGDAYYHDGIVTYFKCIDGSKYILAPDFKGEYIIVGKL